MKPLQLKPAASPAEAQALGGEAASGGPKMKILLIDDQPANLFALESLLEGGAFEIVKAFSGAEGLRCLLEQEFALVLLDVLMPGMDGFETAALIRERKLTRETPIIFITATNTNETHVSRGYSLGAVDYIYKPIVPEILKAKVSVFAELHRTMQRLKTNERALRRELNEHGKTALARRESEEKYRQLFSRAHDAIVVFDEAGEAILDANDAALKLYGYSRQELLALTARDLAAPGGAAGGEKSAPGRPAAGAPIQHITKGGRVFLAEITRGPVVVSGRTMTMTLTRDLTEREKAEETERLKQREEMQRKVIATVSHELRTPIAVIKASAEMLRSGGVAKTSPRFLKIIESHADRLSGIVENLLIDAEIESGKIDPKPVAISLRPFIDELVKDFAPLAARRNISIRVSSKEDIDVSMDPEHMSRVFQNLIDNAIKYNKKGGSVQVRTSRIGGRMARISILDTGIGIDLSELALVFQQFFRSQKAKALAIKGTGLGLSILKTLVESNGGRIWAESVIDKGSAFHFTVPLASSVRA